MGIPALSKPEAPDTVEAYDYVLRLRMDRVKASAVEALDKEVGALRAQKGELDRSTPAALWASDLDEFEAAWTRHLEVRVAAQAMTGKSVAKKTVVRKKPVATKATVATVATVAPKATLSIKA